MKRRRKIKYRGRANIAGLNIKKYREALDPHCSQNDLAGKLQLAGLNVHKNMVSMVESGKQGINDIELRTFALVLGVSVADLMDESIYQDGSHNIPMEYSEDSYDVGLATVAEKPKK